MNRYNCLQCLGCFSCLHIFPKSHNKTLCNYTCKNCCSQIPDYRPFTQVIQSSQPGQIPNIKQPISTNSLVSDKADKVPISEKNTMERSSDKKNRMVLSRIRKNRAIIKLARPYLKAKEISPKEISPKEMLEESGAFRAIPDPPIILFPEEGQIVDTERFYLEGSCDPGNIVVVSMEGECVSTFADLSGDWKVLAPFPLIDGIYTAAAVQINGSGQQSHPDSVSFTLEIENTVIDTNLAAENGFKSESSMEFERESLSNDFQSGYEPGMEPEQDRLWSNIPQSGLFRYRKWWERREVDISVRNCLITGIPIFTDENTLRVVNDDYSYFIPMEKIDYIRTADGLRTLD